MSTAEAAPPTGPSRSSRHRRGPRRGGRGGRGGHEGRAPVLPVEATPEPNVPIASTSLAFRPASIAPLADTPSVEPQENNRGRNRRRGGLGRGGRRGGTQLQPMVNGQRAFGGQLTTISNPSSVAGSLAGDAPEFVPGKAVAARNHAQRPARPRRMSKSQAADLATRTHEDITNGQYECVICTNEVLPNSKIWTCKSCWSVLHFSCVKRWAGNEVSTHLQRASANGEMPPPRQWRCPGCNLPKDALPTNYTCWCEKEIEPRSVAGLPPHSCGQTCSKPRAGRCPHPCELICHAGPCPPCGHMGPSLPCFCGKEVSATRCVDTNYESGWTCGQVCGDPLLCGEHTCQRSCHEGLCGKCEVQLESKCYCGKVEKDLACFEREDEQQSHLEDATWTGSFNCGAECRRPFDCGKAEHFCESSCHPQTDSPAHCPLSPDVVTHCPCGKTPLSALLSEPRADCEARIPHCDQKCLKELPCGHQCQQSCHGGECRPCFESVLISCRCGRTNSNTMCHQGIEERPSCSRICRSTLNCGRHECGERCCSGEKKASQRQASKRKHWAINGERPEENFEAEHICLKACGRPLKCGNHNCMELCHKGPCNSCLEANFEEISCACGRTVLQPPQPCGTQPPQCSFDCTRQQNCGHPPMKHQCHVDAEACPKCPFLVEKPCICGKRTLKNQPCWFSEVRCGLPCGKKLKCGIHSCQKECHRPGQCEDATSSCKQLCGRKKTVCEHDCLESCHAPYPCKEIAPCQAKTFITCECQNQKKAVQCLASKTQEGNSKRTLECNDDCLKLQRNAKLAAALNIDPATHTDDHVPYSTQTLAFYASSPKFCQTYEREFRVFAADETEKRLRFKPMQASQRAFLHSLAEDFGLDSESQDPEPHRHVCIFKTPRFVASPMKTLAQCAKPKVAPVVEPPISKPLSRTAEPFNALLLSNPRFALTIDELQGAISSDFSHAQLNSEISFVPSGDIIIQASCSGSWHQKVDAALSSIKSAVAKKMRDSSMASAVTLCTVDGDLNVVRREDDHAGGGWSQVARGGAAANRAPVKESLGSKSSFTVLGSKSVLRKKKETAQEAVDDWEKEVEGWEG